MLRAIFGVMLALILCAGCSGVDKNMSNQSDATRQESLAQVVMSFIVDISALSTEYPELAGFVDRKSDLQSPTEVRFSQGVGPIKEMRGVRARDLEPKGIDLHFLVRRNDNPVWTEGFPDAIVPLDNLEMTLYSGYVLSQQSTPGLDGRLAAIFSEYRQRLRSLNKKAAKALESICR